MKVVWEESDVLPGKQVGRASCGYRGMIAYHGLACNSTQTNYLIVSISTGQLRPRQTRKELAEWLTNYEYLPKELL